MKTIACMILATVLGAIAEVPSPGEKTLFLNAESAGSDWAPLDIELPKPLFIGTPKDVASPNLEKITGEPRKPFLAPKGVTNVALDKPVTSSDRAPGMGELEQITDGDKEGVDGSYVELAEGTQYVQIDLGKRYKLFAVVFWHYHAEARVYYDVAVRVADDPDFIMNVRTLFHNDHDNSAGLGIGKDKEYIEVNEGKLVDLSAKPVEARYVRLYSNGNTSTDLNHWIEVEIYGVAPEG